MRQTIKIDTSKGLMEVEATIFGELAVHKSIDDPDLWVVSIVAVGKKITGKYGEYLNTEKRAKRFAEVCTKLFDWSLIRSQADANKHMKRCNEARYIALIQTIKLPSVRDNLEQSLEHELASMK